MAPLKATPVAAAAATPAVGAAPEEGHNCSSSSSEHVTWRQNKRRKRQQQVALERARQSNALSDVLRQPRRNDREEAVDTHRRKQAGKLLLCAPSAEEPDEWGTFLDLGSTTLGTAPASAFLPSRARIPT